MRKLLPAFACISTLTLTAPAFAADQYKIDERHTYPIFEVNHLGFSTQRGRFNKTSGAITLDRAARRGSVTLTIDVASLDMGFATWNEHMAAEGYFNTAQYPTMTFKSDALVFEGDKVVAADGELTLLGVTKPLRLTVSNFKCGDHPFYHKPMCGAEISASLKRSEFGMTKSIPMVSDEIRIHSAVEAFKE